MTGPQPSGVEGIDNACDYIGVSADGAAAEGGKSLLYLPR